MTGTAIINRENLFSISQLAEFSGIKQHTIRIWEQRYHALVPIRSEGNTRYYDSSQLKRLLNIVSLQDFDHKVSELCQMRDGQLIELLHKYNSKVNGGQSEYFVSQLIAAGMDYNEDLFNALFSRSLLRFGKTDVYKKVIYPILVRMGFMWTADMIPIAQEHFISNLLRQKLYTVINAVPPPKATADSWVLFLPENEYHEISLLFANYLIRLSGKRIFYLGANIPLETLQASVKQTKAENLVLFLVHYTLPEEGQHYIKTLSKLFPKTKIYIGGNQKLMNELIAPKNVHFMRSPEDLEKQLF